MAPAASTPGPAFPSPRISRVLFLGVLIIYAALDISSIRRDSVTYDEFAHLPAGLSYLRTGEFRLEAFNSPLVRMALALPLWRDDSTKLPLDEGWRRHDLWWFGRDFMHENSGRYQAIFERARAMNILLGAWLLVLVYWFGGKLYGRAAGLAAAAILAFDPTFMAHSRLATVDTGAALGFLAAFIALWFFLRAPSTARAAGAGAAIGFALLCKFSAPVIALFPPLFFIIDQRSRKNWRPTLLRLVVYYLAAWLVVCGFFRGEGMGEKIGDLQLQSKTISQLQAAAPGLPLPLPAPLVMGLDETAQYNEEAVINYIRGEFYRGGKWWYYPVAFAVKTPLPELALLVLGLGSLFVRRGGFRERDLFATLPPLFFVAFLSLFTNVNIGVRYLLPAYPFLAIIMARPLADLSPARKWLRWAVGAGIAAILLTNLVTYPDYIPYFNSVAKASENGRPWLADSNLDWGQDLIELKDYLDQQELDHICLVYFGAASPSVYGINYEIPAEPEKCPVLAVSMQYLLGFSYTIFDRGRVYEYPMGRFSYLLDREPAARIGRSIRVFRREPGPD